MLELKEKIINELKKIKRDGIDNLIYYLENGTDFFTAPASTIYHGNEEGGLVQHSWNVYELLKEKVERYKIETKEDTIIICGLLHDLCKTNFYVRGFKWKKVNDKWTKEQCWEVKDKLPVGHGEKSVILIQRFLQLKDEEILAIRWHMASFDPAIHFSYPSGMPFRQANNDYPLVSLLSTADVEASQILEKINNK